MKDPLNKESVCLFLFSVLNLISCPVLFAQTAPIVTGISPVAMAAGGSVTLSGSNFSATPSANIVWFGGVRGTVTAAGTTSLTVRVPLGASNPVRVYTGGLEGQCPVSFVLSFPATASLSASSFNTLVPSQGYVIKNGGNNGLPGTNSFENLKFADLDGDGKPDLICGRLGAYVQFNTSSTPGTISPGTISGGVVVGATFESQDIGNSSVGLLSELTNYQDYAAREGDIDFGDVDGDGLIDIVSSVYRPSNTDRVSIFRNVTSASGSLSSSNFASPVVLPTSGRWGRRVRLGDFDGDGRLDILSIGDNNGGSVFRNTSTSGSISFAAIQDLSAGLVDDFAEIADIDGDGKPDIVARAYADGQIKILRNTSTGSGSISFAAVQPFSIPSGGQGFKLGDLDGDSKTDVLATGNSGKLYILRNNSTSGSPAFDAYYTLSSSSTTNLGDAAIGDLDGDGKSDIAFNDGNYTMYAIKNNSTTGSLSFGSDIRLNTTTLSQYATDVVIQDIDGDGKNDIASLSEYTNGINFFTNTTPSVTLPVTWIDFSAQTQAAGVLLQWSTAAELRNSYFAVERSTREGLGFAEVGRLAGAQSGAGIQAYRWLDTARLSGQIWYRIRQVDDNGSSSYSKTVSVTRGTETTITGAWLSPNPVTSLLHVHMPAGWENGGEWRIFDQEGRLLLRRAASANTADLDCSGWMPGFYTLVLFKGKQRVFSKIFEKL